MPKIHANCFVCLLFVVFSFTILKAQTPTLPQTTLVQNATTSAPQVKPIEPEKKLSFYGDMRFRPEYDWNVTNSDGSVTDPRMRFRMRLRFGFNYQYSNSLSFGARLRTSTANDQQSPNVTVGANEDAVLPIGLDRAFIMYSENGFTAWAGKNPFPFYTHDELFVTRDISPEGLYGSYEYKLSENFKLKPAVAFFIISSSGKSFDLDKSMKAFQLSANYKSGQNELNLSTGYFMLDSLANAPDGTQTYNLSYDFSYSNLKYTYSGFKIPVSVAGNLMLNTATLDNKTIVANNLQNQKTGYSATFEVGKLKVAKDFLLSVTYAHIEKYAVVDYYTQDDWVRWGFPGGASGGRDSNFEGFELRAGYAFGPNCNLLMRTYFVHGIVKNTPAAVALETGNRFRIDLNVGF